MEIGTLRRRSQLNYSLDPAFANRDRNLRCFTLVDSTENQKYKISRARIDSVYASRAKSVYGHKIISGASVLNQLKLLHVTPISRCPFMPLFVRNFTFTPNIAWLFAFRSLVRCAHPAAAAAAIIQESCFSTFDSKMQMGTERRTYDLHVMNGIAEFQREFAGVFGA